MAALGLAFGLCSGLGVACATQPAAVPLGSAPALVEPAPAPTAQAPGTSPEPNASAALPSISPEADTSLALNVYRAAGVPDVDRAWGAHDYERCVAVFADLASGGRNDLPRRGSQRSGALFARLVSVDNFRTAEEAQLPERAERLQRYLEAYPGLLQVYAPANDGIDFSVEQTELIVSLFELLKSALDSSHQRAAEDPTSAEIYVRQQQMTVGVVRGASAMLAEPERYAPALRQYLKAALVRLAPALELHLEPNVASEVRALATADSEPLR